MLVTVTFDLETGAQCSMYRSLVKYPPANVDDTTAIRWRFMGYWA